MDKWRDGCTEYGLVDLVSAKSYLSMVMPLICEPAAGEYFEVQIWDRDSLTQQEAEKLIQDTVIYDNLQRWDVNICYNEEIKREMQEDMEFVYPYEAEQGVPVKISVTELKRLEMQAQQIGEEAWDDRGTQVVPPEKNEIPRPGFLREEEKVTGAHRGTVYHLLFEHLPYECFKQNLTQKEFGVWLQEMVDAGYLTQQESEIVCPGDFCAFLKTELGKRMQKAAVSGKLYREQPFMMGLPADLLYPEVKERETVLVQGIIDAWFWEDEEIILVDYKTDFVQKDLKELVEKYHKQLEYYAEALERVTGHKVREQIIYSVSKREFISVKAK